MPNPSELTRIEEERQAELDAQLPPMFKRWLKLAYPLSKKAMDEAFEKKQNKNST